MAASGPIASCPSRPSASRALMRLFAWVCIVGGVLLAVASFLITAHAPTLNPWPSFVAGMGLIAFGVIVLASRTHR
jgi:hypothetical protein